MNQLNQGNIEKIISVWGDFLNKKTFYIPTLGPVYVSGNSVKIILHDVLENSQTNKFLSFDKNKRWFQKKMEKIILSAIIINDKEIYIPVKDNFKNILKIFYYSNNFPDDKILLEAKKIYAKMKTSNEINSLYFYCFKKPKTEIKFSCHNIYLKNITSKDSFVKFPEGIGFYNKLPVETQLTFSDLGKERLLENFSFLWKEFMIKNKKLNSIICAMEKNRIVGAIGPLDIAIDARSELFLFPPHFGVIKKMRRAGIGEKLWKSAMSFAYKKGAKYTLVQNALNSPASLFYEKQKLSNANRIYSCLLAK